MIDSSIKPGTAETAEPWAPVPVLFDLERKEESRFKAAPGSEVKGEEQAAEPGMLLAGEAPVAVGTAVGIVILVVLLGYVMKRDLNRRNGPPRGHAPRPRRAAAEGDGLPDA
jgi:hypothetical protein